jgi:hypothetical protein
MLLPIAFELLGEVDFDELALRTSAYRPQERQALAEHQCRIGLNS